MNVVEVSIITPSYKSDQFISEAIQSVLNQTYKKWEMLIVDDASPDNSNYTIEEYIQQDDRIKLIKLEKNVGAAEARNKALQIARGRYIAFLDSDDIWLPSKLEVQLDFMQHKGYAFTFSDYTPFSEDGKIYYHTIRAPKEIDYIGYCKNTIIGCLTVVIDKEQVGEFRMPNIRSSHDMALWLLIMKRGFKAYGVNEILAQYRVVSSSNTANKHKAALEVWNVYRKVERLTFFKSTWYFVHYLYHAIKKRL